MILTRVRTWARASGEVNGGRRGVVFVFVLMDISSRYSSAAMDWPIVMEVVGLSVMLLKVVGLGLELEVMMRIGTVAEGFSARWAGESCSPFSRFTNVVV